MPIIDTESLITSLHDIGAIKFGEFTLKSGETSPVYLDLRMLVDRPPTLRRVARMMLALSAGLSFDRIAAIPMAGLPIGVALSLASDIPLIYPRLNPKAHGTERFIEGTYRPGEQVLVIDDVISRAHSKLEAIRLLETVQLHVTDVFVVIDRQMSGARYLAEQGYNVHAIMTLQDVLDTLLALDRITDDQHHFITAWLEESRTTNRNAP